MKLEKAIVKSFDADGYTAIIQLTGSYKTYLENITVAKNISSVEMVTGRQVVVLFFNEYNPKDAVVIAVYE
jgi:hypothetical protein